MVQILMMMCVLYTTASSVSSVKQSQTQKVCKNWQKVSIKYHVGSKVYKLESAKNNTLWVKLRNQFYDG